MHSPDLQPFIDEYRPRLSAEHGQIFHVALIGIWTYREFLKVIADRFAHNDRALYAAVRESFSRLLQLSPEQRLAELTNQQQLEVALHLEIESFYLFAKILLDKVARFVQYFFGQIRGKPLTSHNDLSKLLGEHVKTYQLTPPSGYEETVQRLRTEIARFRDHYIAHEQSPRTHRGTSWQNKEPAQLSLSRVYSKPNEQQVLSGSVPHLLEQLETYLKLFRELIATNFQKTALKLHETGSHTKDA